jgi:phage replication-related protein YjqB (UPF0714/DUF867 family)
VLEALLREPGVVEERTLRSPFGFMAIHGGSLERGTAEIAAAAANTAGASLYAVVQPEGFRWHIPSTRFAPAASPRLASFLEHVEVVISLHGYGRPELRRSLLVGGADRVLAAGLASTLRSALPEYDIVDALDRIPEGMRGVHPANPVNCARGPGVQLELCQHVRESAEHRNALVGALAKFAASYTDHQPAR